VTKTKAHIKEIAAAVTLLILACSIVIRVHIYNTNHRIIPPQLARQISFTIFWPNSVNANANKQSIKYDSQEGVFSYVVSINAVSTTVTEQATPSEFVDISTYFPALINHMNNYDTFGSANGNVYLTRPNNTNGETAVINHNGTLLFAHAQGNLSENNWRLFFNNLQVIEN